MHYLKNDGGEEIEMGERIEISVMENKQADI